MKVLKSLEDIEAAGLSPPVRDAAREVLENLIRAYAEYGQSYDPDDDGYVIVIEGGEPDAAVEAEAGYALGAARFEGGVLAHGCFVTCTLHNNQFGISWVIVDSPALDPALRARLLAECGAGVPR
jgi:hypothetical protein